MATRGRPLSAGQRRAELWCELQAKTHEAIQIEHDRLRLMRALTELDDRVAA